MNEDFRRRPFRWLGHATHGTDDLSIVLEGLLNELGTADLSTLEAMLKHDTGAVLDAIRSTAAQTEGTEKNKLVGSEYHFVIACVFLHFCSLAKGASKPTHAYIVTVLTQWCSLCRGCSLCWGGMRGVFGAMPSVSTRYRGAASSPARA